MARVLAITNQKGGVGKTTTAVNLSAALTTLGRKVLIVDVDPQGNTTSGLGIEKQNLEHCIYDVIMNTASVEESIVHTEVAGLDVVPATLRLAGAEVELAAAIAREKRLYNALQPVQDVYDYIFIDCPPSLGLLTINALAASDGVLVPIQCEFYALEGLGQLMQVVDMVKNHLKSDIGITGVVLTLYDSRLNLSDQVADEVKQHFGNLIYGTVIPRNVKLAEAPSFGQPITVYDPDSKGANAYIKLAEEVDKREQESIR